jgi:hypothetical protein
LVAAVARHVQDESKRPPTADDAAELRMVFSRMTRWSKEHEPGFVAGLSRKNGPDSQSWIDDARIWFGELQEMQGPAVVAEGPSPEDALSELEQALGGAATAHEVQTSVKHALESGLTQSDPRLVALLTPHQSMLKGGGGLKTLKSQLREAERADDERQDSEDSASPVPADWAWHDRTRGKNAVILGGDPRPQAVKRIKDAFGFASVTWEELDPRRVSAVGQRVRRGSVDVVILLRSFLSHKVQDAIQPACKESQTPVCLVDTGYGVTQVQRAIERDL